MSYTNKNMGISPNFTPSSQRIVKEAKSIAVKLGSSRVLIEHLCLAILRKENAILSVAFSNLNLSQSEILDYVLYLSSSLDKDLDEASDAVYSSEVGRILAKAHEISLSLYCDYISEEHMFLSILEDETSPLEEFLYALKTTKHNLYESIFAVARADAVMEKPLPRLPVNPSSASSFDSGYRESVESPYSVNLNELAMRDNPIPIIGKDKEVKRICEILSRKYKNNPLLIGEPGVGKTAVVDGLVQSLVSGRVPSHLLPKQVYSLDLAGMLAGTKYRGSFEDRLKKVLKSCEENRSAVLFIDEIHTIVGAGNSEGSLDAANMLKDPLSRGKLSCIGATTLSEYKKHILKDPALSRRFEVVFIKEPSKKETLDILKGIKKSFELFHEVKYSLKSLKAIVDLSGRFFPSKNFPDKAIDILDEVGASFKSERNKPLDSVIKAYETLKEYREAGIPDTEALLDPEVTALENKSAPDYPSLIRVSHVEELVARKSQVPIAFVSQKPGENLSKAFPLVNSRVMGQAEAVNSVFQRLGAAALGCNNDKEPMGSFLFLGKTGVGKTFLAEEISKTLFGDKSLIRLNMSEYSDQVSANKLIGSSPGYVGYEEGGILIDKIRNSPHSVILFDEIEKSTPSVFNLLLQMLEEGCIEDGLGNKAYLKDSIIIMTGNIGSHHLDKGSFGFHSEGGQGEDKVRDEAKKILSPELINRIGDVIIFNDIPRSILEDVYHKEIKTLKDTLKRGGISLDINEDVNGFIVDLAENESSGVRPIRRLIKKHIEGLVVSHHIKNSSPRHSQRLELYVSETNSVLLKS